MPYYRCALLSQVSARHQTDSPLRAAIQAAVEEGRYRSQAHFARRAGINESQLSRYVNGLRPGPKLRAKLARALRKSEEELGW